jgi:hypothetical protein
MPELHIERIYKLRNFPSVDVRVVVSSTEGAIMGTAQTGGRMQVILSSSKAVRINAGVLPPITRTAVVSQLPHAQRYELPLYVTKIIQEAGRSLGPSACFPSRFSISCTVENRSITQDEALRILEDIGRKLEQQVEHVEFEPRGMPVISEYRRGY